jgi:hypothetical protein
MGWGRYDESAPAPQTLGERNYRDMSRGILDELPTLRHTVEDTIILLVVGCIVVLVGAILAKIDNTFFLFVGAGVLIWAIMLLKFIFEKSWIDERERFRIKQKTAMLYPASTRSEPERAFASRAFVDFIFDWWERTGKLPTIDECTTDGRFPRNVSQDSYTDMVNAGAITGRREGVSAGVPAEA